jgi:Tfp pilus assembly protein PilF
MNTSERHIAKLHAAAQKALQQGLLREVHQHCLAILNIDSSFADAWFLCGVIAAHNGQTAKAVEILDQAIELAPQNPEYRAELGKQLIALDVPEKALQQAAIALALDPDTPTTLHTLGTVFSHTGEHQKALECYDLTARLLHERPRGKDSLSAQWLANFHFNHGASLQFAGRLDAAEAAYEHAIQLQPHMFKAHSALSSLRRQTPACNHLTRLQALRANATSARDQLHLGHAIAKELEDLEQYQEAFASLEWAKQRRAAEVRFSIDSQSEYFSSIERLFDRDLFKTTRTCCDNPEPIFIVGMPRSGTTLVEQILASHSQVYTAGELQNFPLQVRRSTNAEPSEFLDITALSKSLELDLGKLGADYIASTRPRTGHTPHFIDKLPLNFFLLGLIHLALPNAKLICLRRDPMDTCLSNFRQLFAVDFKPYQYNYNLLDCGRYYLLFDRLMRHWQTVMPGAVHEVCYEALVADPEHVSRELLQHCGLRWEEQCLDFHQRSNSVATPSAVQVKQQIYTHSVNRWQRYGDALRPLHELFQSAGLYP